MKKLLIHLGLLFLMIALIIINIFQKNMSGLIAGSIAATCWFILSIEDIIDLKCR
jgi:hypothetical protein